MCDKCHNKKAWLVHAVSPDENTLDILQQLSDYGYDSVEFISKENACKTCKDKEDETLVQPINLDDFISKGSGVKWASIFRTTHPACVCDIVVYKRTNKDFPRIRFDWKGTMLTDDETTQIKDAMAQEK